MNPPARLLALSLLAATALTGCPSEPAPEPVSDTLDAAVLAALSMERVRDGVDLLADDAWGGRTPGSPGHAAAADWVAQTMADTGLEALDGGFEVAHTLVQEDQRWMFDESGAVVQAPTGELPGRQFIGLLPGTDPVLADEYILVMAHYDHLGVNAAGEVFNGAFDDATAVSALLELAAVLVDQGVSFRRSLLFLITDMEEGGLKGARAWVDDPTVPLGEIALALSIDPIGRPLVGDYAPLAALGSERCPGARALWDRVEALTGVPILQINREPLVVFGSDQDAFWDHPDPLPGAWLASPGMTWYHTTSDTAETIDYRSVRDHLGAIAQGIAIFANRDERCVDLGAQDLATSDVDEALELIAALFATGELTSAEALDLSALQTPLENAAAAGAVDTEAQTAFFQLLVLVINELAPGHPGPIPPPFPG